MERRASLDIRQVNNMNQLDYIDQLRSNEIKPEFILDHLACWFSADQIKEFFEDFVNSHDITFGDEDDM